jgi:alkanesulfonate monooxygenase
MNLRFHWMLPKGGEVAMGSAQAAARYRIESTCKSSPSSAADMPGWARFARAAEESGIDSVLISFSKHEPDPLLAACALGRETEKLKFIVAFRSGLMQPAAFVQQVNTLSQLIGGRVSLNLVAGSSREEQRGYGDFLAHDQRYERAQEFMAVCHALWRNRNESEVHYDGKYYRVEAADMRSPFRAADRIAPEIYVSGHSEQARRLAREEGSCWLRVIDTPENLRALVESARADGIEVCLRLCIVCRPTRDEAIRVLESLLPDDDVGARARTAALKNDSQMYREAAASDASPWLNRQLWAGFAPLYGPVWTTLLGTPDEVAGAFLEYQRLGVTQFIISGWPELDEMVIFGRDVLPIVREAERRQFRQDSETIAKPIGSKCSTASAGLPMTSDDVLR